MLDWGGVMAEDVYRLLAKRLDSIPNGFPTTESGVELRLLAKIFIPEEAGLASVMRLKREPADAIAARAGLEAESARCFNAPAECKFGAEVVRLVPLTIR